MMMEEQRDLYRTILFHTPQVWLRWHTNPFEWRRFTETGWWAP